MQRQEFLDAVLEALSSETRRLPSSVVKHIADLVYDPLLCDDDKKQFIYAARVFARYADGFYQLFDALAKIKREL